MATLERMRTTDRIGRWAHGYARERRVVDGGPTRWQLPASDLVELETFVEGGLVELFESGSFRLAGPPTHQRDYAPPSGGAHMDDPRRRLVQLQAFGELVTQHGWPASRIVLDDGVDLVGLGADHEVRVACETRATHEEGRELLDRLNDDGPSGDAERSKLRARLHGLRPEALWIVAPGVRAAFRFHPDGDAGKPTLTRTIALPAALDGRLECPACGAEDLWGMRLTSDGRITLMCNVCEERWSRNPRC